MATKKKRAARELPLERFVTTEEKSASWPNTPSRASTSQTQIIPTTTPNIRNRFRGPGAPCRWSLPDIYRYAEKLKQRSKGPLLAR